MKAAWVDFRTVKACVTMEMALASYGVMLRRVDPSYLRGRCPLPTHSSKSSTQSFIVNTEKNAWACHSDSCSAARSGRPDGNVLDFVAWMEDCSIRDAALKLQDWFDLNLAAGKARSAAAREDRPPVDLSPTEENSPLSFSLTDIDVRHPYLKDRSITAETAEYFGIGFFSKKGLMAGRIVIPIHNEEGVLVAYAGRGLDQTEPKYLFREVVVLMDGTRPGAGPVLRLLPAWFPRFPPSSSKSQLAANRIS
jgi:DNA primase